jgi:hypothetical protein
VNADKPRTSTEDKFQTNRKRMRAIADMLDILARFEDEDDRMALIVAVVSTANEKGERFIDERMREFYGKEGRR